jgi:ABC-type nickel/cobalt efflux system permease component RcnA
MTRAMYGHGRRWLLLVLVALTAAAPFAAVREAAAHPLGNFSVNRYARIELYREAIRLYYVLDLAEIPTFQLKERIDSDGDGELSPAEVEAYLASERTALLAGFDLRVGGERVDLAPIEQRAQVLAGQANLEVLRAVFVYGAPVARSGELAVTFSDRNNEERAGWKEIVVRPSPGTVATVSEDLLADTSNELLSYPADSLTSAPDERSAAFRWDPATGEAAPATASITLASGARRAGGLSGLITGRQSASVILLSLLAAFGFGALHALGPGHGKSVVAAYLVGSRGTVRHAAALGLTVTATHTSTVYLLGFVTLTASEFIVPERLSLYLGVAAGAMVVVMGLALFVSRLRQLRRPARADGVHRHGFFGRPHAHASGGHTHDHDHEHVDGHVHSHAGPDAHAHAPVAPGVTWRGLFTLGVAGGLIPCPSAIVVMLAAISLGQVLFGMLLIVAFSAGLAGVLTAIGMALVLGKRLSGRFGAAWLGGQPLVVRALAAFPVLSALGVTVAGILISYQAWNQPL